MWNEDVQDREVRKKKKYRPVYKKNYKRKPKKDEQWQKTTN